MKARNFTSALIFLLVTGFTVTSSADHGPRIQFIHNVATEAAASVDIWVSYGEAFYPAYKLHGGLNYKEATEFTTFGLIYGDLTFYVTPAGSIDISDYFFKETFGQPQIDYEETFVIVLTGDSADNFDMILNDGREDAQISYKTSVSVFHGSIDAPDVNIAEVSVPVGIIVNNLEYRESTDYLSLDAADYVLQVQTTDGTAVADFFVPLSLYQGQALFIVATGYLDTTGVTPNNPFKLLAVQANGTVNELNPLIANGSPPRVQIIHNSAAEAAAEVDVWITDNDGSAKLLSNFGYKDATPYLDAPDLFTVSITATGSQDTTNAVFHKTFLLNQATSYVVVAAGDPGTNFDLFATDGLELASTSGKTDVKVFHGSVGAPMVDVDEVRIPAGLIVNDLSFGEAKGFLNLAASDYNLQVKTQEGIGAAEFIVPLSTFSDSVLFVAASGYLDATGLNPNNPFMLLAVTPSGTVFELSPETSLTPAKIQVIHNSAVPALDFVDIYLNDEKILDNFEFRTATPFIEVPGATQFTVDIDTKSSIDNSFPIYSDSLVLESGRTYIVVASGVIVFGSENYFPPKGFDLIPILDAREMSMNSDKVDVVVFHGSTDIPMVDINELSIPVDELVNDIDYGMSQGYLELDPTAYELEVALASSGTSVKTFNADLSPFQGQAITIVASGFFDPLKNNNGASFGLWVALPEGGDLIELSSVFTSVEQNIIEAATMKVYPNPTSDFIKMDFNLLESTDVNVYVYDLNGRVLQSAAYGNLQKSNYNMSMNLNGLSTGSYFVTIQAGESVITKKIQVNN
jgi:hypothetical protein